MIIVFQNCRQFFSAFTLYLACCAAFAGPFIVNPARLDVGHRAKSASVTVTNEGTEKLSFHMQAMDWTQDKDGKDVYTESGDLIFFPKLMTIEPGQEAVVRVGFKTPATTTERTYRLFIEELPGAVKNVEGSGVQINFLVRFGLPIFGSPALPQDGLDIEGAALKNGVLSFMAHNSGNRHQMYKSIRIEGTNAANKPVFGLDIADRYLLASSTKPYKASLSAQQCKELTSLIIDIQTDKVLKSQKIDVKPAMCQ